MTDSDIARECERYFQNGGSRTQVRDAVGALLHPAASRAAALRSAAPGEVVWHRGKLHGERRYAWSKKVAK
jgi:hypothetical protein